MNTAEADWDGLPKNPIRLQRAQIFFLLFVQEHATAFFLVLSGAFTNQFDSIFSVLSHRFVIKTFLFRQSWNFVRVFDDFLLCPGALPFLRHQFRCVPYGGFRRVASFAAALLCSSAQKGSP